MYYKNKILFSTFVICTIFFICLSGSRSEIFPVDTRDWSWLLKPQVPKDDMTKILNEIWLSSKTNAINAVYELEIVKNSTIHEGKFAALLLQSVALEHAGDTSAVSSYIRLINMAEGTPYASSAAFRLRLLRERDVPTSNDVEKIYKLLAKEPDGWFLIDNQWSWITKTITLEKLLEIRADSPSSRFFNFLYSKSTFPVVYSYLFVFLILTIGIKILELPLLFRTVKFAAYLNHLSPQIEAIKNSTISDQEAQIKINQLYKAEGINPMSGCAVFIVDLIFVIWALIALSTFSPRFILDDAKFLWVSDITRFDFRLLLCWMGFNIFQSLATSGLQKFSNMLGQSCAQMLWSTIISNLIFGFIAWHWDWPAYVFIFWAMLGVLGLFLTMILRIVIRK